MFSEAIIGILLIVVLGLIIGFSDNDPGAPGTNYL